MSTENLRVVQDGWDAWNAHDIEAALRNLDEKHVWETDTLPAPAVGRDAYRQAMQMYIAAFPDLRFTIDQLLPSGDYVVTRYTATGTQKGESVPSPRSAMARLPARGCTGTQDICSGSWVSCPHDVRPGAVSRGPLTVQRT